MARALLVTSLLAALMSLAGCGASAPPSTAITTAPPATTVIASSEPSSGSPQPTITVLVPSLTLPAGWRNVELSEAGLRDLVTSLGTSNPQLVSSMNQLLASGQFKGFLFYAVGLDGNRYIGNVNVSSFPLSGLNFDSLTPLLEDQLRQIGATDFSDSRVSIPAGDALRIGYTVTVTQGAAPVAVNGRLYVVVVQGSAYQVTFSCPSPSPDTCLSEADSMIPTLELTPPA